MKTTFLTKSKLLPVFLPVWCRVVSMLLLLWLLVTSSSWAQNKIWDKAFGGDKSEYLTAILPTTDGGYLLGGISDSGKSGEKSEEAKGLWLIKLDAKGSKLWDKSPGFNIKLHTMINTPDGGYLLGGTASTESTLEDYSVVKIDANGNKLWEKTLGGSKSDVLNSLLLTFEGNYLLGGSSNSGISGDKSEASEDDGSGDLWIVKLKADGSKIWDKTFGGNGGDKFSALVATSDGGYLLGGTSTSGISGDKSEAKRGSDDETGDFWVIKVNSNGKKLWDKTIGGNHYEFFQAMVVTPDGGFLLGGTSYSGKSGEKSADNTYPRDNSGNPLPAYWIVKIDANGKKIWDKNYGSNGHYLYSDEMRAMISSPGGGYVLGGAAYGRKGVEKSEDKIGFWVIKLKEDGTKVWDKTFTDGSNEPSAPLWAMVATPDKGILLGGTSGAGIGGDKSEARRGESDYWLIKVGNSNKKVQEITFPTFITKTLGDAPIILSARASSGLSVTFSLVSGPGTLQNNALTIIGVGRIIVRASQAGDATYAAASNVLQTILVEVPTPLVTKVWDKTFGGKNQDLLGAVIAAPDGGYLLGGTYTYPGEFEDVGSGYSFVKINKEGTKIWDLAWETNGYYGTTLNNMVSTPDEGYLVSGTQHGFEDHNEIFKISSKGTQEWKKFFRSNESYNDRFTYLIAAPDGGYLLGGYSNSGKGGDKSEDSRGEVDYWIIKIDNQGNKLWDKTYGGNNHDNLSAIMPTKDDGFLLGGSSSSGKGGEKSDENRSGHDYWVIKIDKNGKKLWDKTFGGNKVEALRAIITTEDGGYLLGGFSSSGKSGEKSEPNKGTLNEYGELSVDYWLVKIDASGKKLWDKTLGGNQDDYLKILVATADGGYVLGGSSASGIGGDRTRESRGERDYWLVRIDASGKKIWDKTYGTSQLDEFSSLIAGTDGSYLLGGYTTAGIDGDKSEPDLNNSTGLRGDLWLVKIKEDLPLTVQWDFRYGGSENDGFTTLIKTSDGGYLSGGYSASRIGGDKSQASQGKNDYWIVKSDKNGKRLWDKRYGGSEDDFLNTIIPTKEGGYLLAGSSLSGKGGDKTERSRGSRDFWLIKVDKAGTKQWDKRFGGSNDEELQKVVQLATGEYILAGVSNSPASGDKSQYSQGGSDYWLVKISSTGSKLWDKRYGGSFDENLETLVLTSDEGFLLGGSSLSGKSGDKTQAGWGSKDYWVVRVDSKGKKVWDQRYGGSGEDNLMDVVRTSTGEFLLAGHSTSGAEGDRSQDSRGGKDFWLVKVNSSGEKVWDKRYGGSQHEGLRTILQTKEDGYLLAGRSESGKSGDKTQESQGSSDYWIVKVNNKGVKQWDKRFGGTGYEEIRMVLPTIDGGYLLGGRSNSGGSGDRTQPSQGGYDYWLVKVASESTPIVAERAASQEAELVVESKLILFTMYPNPAREKLTVFFTLPHTQLASVKVYDNQGGEITTLFQGEVKADQKYEVEWQATNKAAGLYFLQLQTPTKRYFQKMLLMR